MFYITETSCEKKRLSLRASLSNVKIVEIISFVTQLKQGALPTPCTHCFARCLTKKVIPRGLKAHEELLCPSCTKALVAGLDVQHQ